MKYIRVGMTVRTTDSLEGEILEELKGKRSVMYRLRVLKPDKAAGDVVLIRLNQIRSSRWPSTS
jgi:hypothetical protein